MDQQCSDMFEAGLADLRQQALVAAGKFSWRAV